MDGRSTPLHRWSCSLRPMSAPKLANAHHPPAGLKFVSTMRVFRRFECSDGATVQRRYWSTGAREHGSTVLPDETRLERGSIRPPIKDDCDFIFTREL